jgi:hypothetical protein
VITLDDVANSLDAHQLSELSSDALARLAERIGLAKVKIDIALMLSHNGAAPPPAMLSVDEAAKAER